MTKALLAAGGASPAASDARGPLGGAFEEAVVREDMVAIGPALGPRGKRRASLEVRVAEAIEVVGDV